MAGERAACSLLADRGAWGDCIPKFRPAAEFAQNPPEGKPQAGTGLCSRPSAGRRSPVSSFPISILRVDNTPPPARVLGASRKPLPCPHAGMTLPYARLFPEGPPAPPGFTAPLLGLQQGRLTPFNACLLICYRKDTVSKYLAFP